MKLASREHKNATTLAISSGSPIRPNGVFAIQLGLTRDSSAAALGPSHFY